MRLKRTLPHITRKRFITVAIAVISFATIMYLLTPEVMPPWVYRWHIPLWFAHKWPVLFVGLWLIGTALCAWLQWTKLPPAPRATEMPLWPSLNNSQFWQRHESEEHRRAHMRL